MATTIETQRDLDIREWNVRAINSLRNLVTNPLFHGDTPHEISIALRDAPDFGEESLLLNLSAAIAILRKNQSGHD